MLLAPVLSPHFRMQQTCKIKAQSQCKTRLWITLPNFAVEKKLKILFWVSEFPEPYRLDVIFLPFIRGENWFAVSKATWLDWYKLSLKKLFVELLIKFASVSAVGSQKKSPNKSRAGKLNLKFSQIYTYIWNTSVCELQMVWIIWIRGKLIKIVLAIEKLCGIQVG